MQVCRCRCIDAAVYRSSRKHLRRPMLMKRTSLAPNARRPSKTEGKLGFGLPSANASCTKCVSIVRNRRKTVLVCKSFPSAKVLFYWCVCVNHLNRCKTSTLFSRLTSSCQHSVSVLTTFYNFNSAGGPWAHRWHRRTKTCRRENVPAFSQFSSYGNRPSQEPACRSFR